MGVFEILSVWTLSLFLHFTYITSMKFIIRIMVFPLDDNFVFGDNFFFWLIIFFSPKATKKITQPRKKKLYTNKRIYSSNGNTIIPMILRFYATPTPFFWEKVGKKSGDIISNISYIGSTFLLQSTFNIVSLKYNLNIFSINEHVL